MANFANGHKKVGTPVVWYVPHSPRWSLPNVQSRHLQKPVRIESNCFRNRLLEASIPPYLVKIDVSLVLKHPMLWLFLYQNSKTRLDRELSQKDAWMLE